VAYGYLGWSQGKFEPVPFLCQQVAQLFFQFVHFKKFDKLASRRACLTLESKMVLKGDIRQME
jgi:hypothetical protein